MPAHPSEPPALQRLQELVDGLADRLGRSVVINDPAVRMLCTSRHFGDEDEVRVRAVLQRDAGAEVSRHVLDQARTDSGAIFDVAALLALGEALNGPDGDEAARAFVRSMFSGEPDPALWAFVEQEIKSTPPHAGVPLLWDHCAQDWRDVLPRIDVPTLVIGCEGSHVDPGSQRYIGEQIPGAQLHVFGRDVAGAHFPFLENPAAFNAVVEEFLDRP